jgi:3-hydroxy-9,10-secoandrosta-1,3,5(10)-triene-9,17-dione monooxygenase
MTGREELLERVESLLPAIQARSSWVAENGRLHPDTVSELDDAGIMKTLIPQRYGGYELNVDTMSDISRTLASACMSTGWVMGFFVGHNWMVTRFSEQTQDDVYNGNPNPKIPGQIRPTHTARRVKGGYELNGRSKWNSGIMHADWVLTGIAIDDEPPQLALVKAGDYEVDEVWDMAAMEGSGSNDMICHDTFVPDHRVCEVPGFVEGRTAGNQQYTNPLYLMPVLPFMYTEVISVMVGGLEGATAHYIAQLQGRDAAYSQGKLAEMQSVHVKIGEAASRARTARKLIDSNIAETLEIQQSREFTMEDRLRLKLDAGTVANHCRVSINELIHDAGARSFENQSPIQAHFRDINALAVHAFWDWHVCREQYGRGQMGLEPSHPLL